MKCLRITECKVEGNSSLFVCNSSSEHIQSGCNFKCEKVGSVSAAQSCPTLQPTGLLRPRDSPGRDTGGGSHPLLQGIFLTQGLSPGLLHCMRVLYRLSHQEALKSNSILFNSSRILFSSSPDAIPKNPTRW